MAYLSTVYTYPHFQIDEYDDHIDIIKPSTGASFYLPLSSLPSLISIFTAILSAADGSGK